MTGLEGGRGRTAPTPSDDGGHQHPQRGVVVVTAPWCVECRAMRPALDEVAMRHPEVTVTEIDASTQPGIAADLGVKGTPTIIVHGDGRELLRRTGRQTTPELERVFSALADRAVPTRRPGVNAWLRLGAGVVLAAAGLVSGPSWALVVIGIAISLFGLASMRSG